jgi:hypothetical protein
LIPKHGLEAGLLRWIAKDASLVCHDPDLG